MNREEYEEADRENFSTLRQELTTGCKECGARLTGSNEKALKKRRKQHTTLHLRSVLYIEGLMDRIGAKEEPDGKLLEHLERLTDSLARNLHLEFKTYLRFVLDRAEVWPRLKVGQKGNLEYHVKEDWRSLEDREKEGFLKIAKGFVEIVFPEVFPLIDAEHPRPEGSSEEIHQ